MPREKVFLEVTMQYQPTPEYLGPFIRERFLALTANGESKGSFDRLTSELTESLPLGKREINSYRAWVKIFASHAIQEWQADPEVRFATLPETEELISLTYQLRSLAGEKHEHDKILSEFCEEFGISLQNAQALVDIYEGKLFTPSAAELRKLAAKNRDSSVSAITEAAPSPSRSLSIAHLQGLEPLELALIQVALFYTSRLGRDLITSCRSNPQKIQNHQGLSELYLTSKLYTHLINSSPSSQGLSIFFKYIAEVTEDDFKGFTKLEESENQHKLQELVESGYLEPRYRIGEPIRYVPNAVSRLYRVIDRTLNEAPEGDNFDLSTSILEAEQFVRQACRDVLW